MIRRVEDLAPLLAQQPSGSVGFRQGTVVAWDPITASNVVDVGGTLLTDVPILNSTESLILKPNDVVGLLSTGEGAKSFWIVGRITIPGTPQAASALTAVGLRGASWDGVMTTMSSTSYVDIPNSPSVSVLIGQSRRCIVIIGASFLWNSDQAGFTGNAAYITVGSTAPDGSVDTISFGDSRALACSMNDGSTGKDAYPGTEFISASKVMYYDEPTGNLSQTGTWTFRLKGRVNGGSVVMSNGHLAILPF